MKRTLVVGAARAHRLPAKVCEYTFQRASSAPFDVVHTYGMEFGSSPWLRERNRTGFSYVRLAVPELAGYEGLAIYLDSDMLVFKDPMKLTELPFDGAAVLRPKNQAAVLLYDCARLRHWRSGDVLARLERGECRYADLVETLGDPASVRVGIPDEWNRLDVYYREVTGVLHYTDMARQPWVYEHNGLSWHWYEALRSAVRAGHVTLDEVRAEVAAGHVGPWVLKEASL